MIFPGFFREQGWGGQSGGQQEVRSPKFDFLVCCGCLLSWASLFPSLCLSFFLCNIMLMSPCCIWVLSVELGWGDRQGSKFSLLVGVRLSVTVKNGFQLYLPGCRCTDFIIYAMYLGG